MAINRHTHPYEILFRLRQDGSVQGCHRKDLEIVKDDDTGEIFSARETDPMPIAGDHIDSVLGVVNSALIVSLAEVQALADTIEGQLRKCEADAQSIEHERDDLAVQLNQANETIQELTAQVQELLSRLVGTATEVETTGEQA